MLHGNSLQHEIFLDSMKFLIMLNLSIKKEFILSKNFFHVFDDFYATNNHNRCYCISSAHYLLNISDIVSHIEFIVSPPLEHSSALVVMPMALRKSAPPFSRRVEMRRSLLLNLRKCEPEA